MLKFSICIPAYKSTFLKECIESILKQVIQNFELIILNDCSPEPIEEIIFSFSDNRIKYYKNEVNIGAENLVDNWNRCLDLSSGEYIVIMGDDDTLEPNYLQKFDSLIKMYPNHNVFHCRSRIINETNKTIGFTQCWGEVESVYDYMWQKMEYRRLQYISDFVYKRSFLKKINGFYKLPLAWGSDVITSFIAAKEYGIIHTNELIFNYRSNSLTISSSVNTMLKIKAIYQMEEFLNSFLKSEPNNDFDKVLYINIKKYALSNFIVRNKKSIIKKHIKNNNFFGFLNLLLLRNRYKISTIDILKAITRN